MKLGSENKMMEFNGKEWLGNLNIDDRSIKTKTKRILA